MNKLFLSTCAIVAVIGMGTVLFFKNSGENSAPADSEQARIDALVQAESKKIHVLNDDEISAQEDRERAKQEADEARRQAVQEAAEDTVSAKKWGLSLAVFRRAKEMEAGAYSDCIDALKKSARYDVKNDWVPNYSWRSDGETISIDGRDVHVQNGFGAYAAGYSCTWDIKTKTITALDAN